MFFHQRDTMEKHRASELWDEEGSLEGLSGEV